jgi:hypothetical protein
MKKVLKTEQVMEAFNILNAATYKKLDDADKVKLWKIARALKPVAKQFEEDSKDAAEKLKPENLDAQLEKARDYEAKKQKGDDDLPMTDAEYQAFIHEVWTPFNTLVAKAVREFADKEVEIDFEPLSEEAFGKLMASNDWTISKADVIGNLIIE